MHLDFLGPGSVGAAERHSSCCNVDKTAVYAILLLLQTSTYSSCSSDDSEDSDAALRPGLSLDPATQHTALTVKTEPREQEDGLPEAKPFNGILLQGKGERHSYVSVIHSSQHFELNLIELLMEHKGHIFSFSVNSADQKSDKTSLYNFSKLKKNRKWLKVHERQFLHSCTDVCIHLINRFHK